MFSCVVVCVYARARAILLKFCIKYYAFKTADIKSCFSSLSNYPLDVENEFRDKETRSEATK